MSLTGCLYRGKGFRLFASDILGTWSSFFFGSHNLSSFVEVGYVFLCLVLILVCKERKRIWLEVNYELYELCEFHMGLGGCYSSKTLTAFLMLS